MKEMSEEAFPIIEGLWSFIENDELEENKLYSIVEMKDRKLNVYICLHENCKRGVCFGVSIHKQCILLLNLQEQKHCIYFISGKCKFSLLWLCIINSTKLCLCFSESYK